MYQSFFEFFFRSYLVIGNTVIWLAATSLIANRAGIEGTANVIFLLLSLMWTILLLNMVLYVLGKDETRVVRGWLFVVLSGAALVLGYFLTK